MMNKNNGILFLLFCLCLSCKTSGDLAAERDGQDPGEIRTLPTPVGSVEQAPVVNEDSAREMEVLRGKLQEMEYLHQTEKAQLETKVAQLEAEKKAFAEEIDVLKGGGSSEATKGGDLLWETAQKDLQAKNYAKAVTTFKDFIENFPKDPRAEEALILKAQAEYSAEEFKEALVSFGLYLDKYPKGKQGAMAWLGQGVALIRMKQKKDAKLFLEQCVSLYPKSHEARLAKKLLKEPRLVPATLFKV
jgi:tol-pal system protein YbgF